MLPENQNKVLKPQPLCGMMEDYRDVHNSEAHMERNLERIKQSNMSKRQIGMIQRFVQDIRIGKVGKTVKAKRMVSYLQYLMELSTYFGKDLDTITEGEATQFYIDLQDDKIRRRNGMPYADATKDEFIKALRRYLGWVWGGREKKKYQKHVAWMKEFYKKSAKKAISLKEARRVVENESVLRNKSLFMLLFDSGARIEEALNIRVKDLTMSQDKDYFMVHLRGTKTEDSDRKFSIPIASELVGNWLREHPTGDEGDYLFPIRYDNARKIIRRMSTKVLGYGLKPHELRHSSATHYVQVFGASNIAGFYYRYGWRFGSKEANTYIKTHLYGGEVGQKKVVEAIESGRVAELEVQIEGLQGDLRGLKSEFEEVKGGKGILSLLLALMKNQERIVAALEDVAGKSIEVLRPREVGEGLPAAGTT